MRTYNVRNGTFDTTRVPPGVSTLGLLPQRMLKIMVIGYGRHGKDTVCEMLKNLYMYDFVSSSMFCADRVMMPISKRSTMTSIMKPELTLPHYNNVEDCFEDRHNHREVWFEAIKNYNGEDPTRLGREIFEEYDVYGGIRNKTEFHALKNAGAFDLSIWVDRGDVLEPEDKTSCTVEPWMADYVLDNNGSLWELERNIISLMENAHAK